ncbi:ABC transporter permease [bacterium]|nr:ABC transporter permease [bacterium]
MRKLFVLAIKEVIVTFRDVGALIVMLVSPLLLTFAFGAAFGAGGEATLSDIPVLMVDHDGGAFAEQVISAFEDQDAEGLLDFELVSDESTARAKVDDDDAAALVVLPADFSRSVVPLLSIAQEDLGLDLLAMSPEDVDALTPEQRQQIGRLFMESQSADQPTPEIEIYASPDYQISASVIQGILRAVLEQMNVTSAGVNAIITNQVNEQLMSGEGDASSSAEDFDFNAENMQETTADDLPIQLDVVSPSGHVFSWLDYSAASMAILFLMFAVTSGGRTLLAERQMGTLPRLAITPTSNLTILVGKMAGIILTGLLQVSVLWGTTSLIGAYWGPPLAVIVALLALVIAATGVGVMISAWANSGGQAGAIGTAFTLIAAAASGSFFPRWSLPQALRTASYVTPNAWGVEIFSRLQSGGDLSSILPLLGGLLILTVVYYTVAAIGLRRNFD